MYVPTYWLVRPATSFLHKCEKTRKEGQTRWPGSAGLLTDNSWLQLHGVVTKEPIVEQEISRRLFAFLRLHGHRF